MKVENRGKSPTHTYNLFMYVNFQHKDKILFLIVFTHCWFVLKTLKFISLL